MIDHCTEFKNKSDLISLISGGNEVERMVSGIENNQYPLMTVFRNAEGCR